ncbi:4-hydroxy-tetrahydrodipicolinate reductase [Candidatus Aquarickettsia rohweri]|uniref:4-hydroxy-tetrahydrodipicolinate reductase n=1 Tax=Candidatus Aquarickettsia rohweri TaxID=2602574 RepID=A0A429XSJ0_9RICK|nr:4-hydroxy-tetrahydrodipicolinate reductase [Candidatus Aquarickettsia rohweri]MSO14202.1 4-hydroxy-tetrahydrodipicolinate reductase [Rickettsiales endosymbiont of Trichoplax sp. H2]RST69797.1 4-hydroxy-tetrahydrodipicolinate reductase [Candidatus Aquarickettsia rohweri]
MKIAIIGYGKMGQMIELEANKLSTPVSKIINNYTELSSTEFDKDEVAIEFTEPSACLKNIEILSSKGVKIVCGTTGWDDNINEVKEIVKKHNTGFIYASNFSIGVNIFWKIIEETSSIINKFDHYDIMGHEIHHNKKKDSPSGTALTTAKIITNKIDRKKQIVTNRIDGEIKPNELHFSSSRCGSIIGKHEVIFDSPTDSIRISHDSKDRSSYAIGAINCAKWIKNKTGFYSIKNYMEELLNE